MVSSRRQGEEQVPAGLMPFLLRRAGEDDAMLGASVCCLHYSSSGWAPAVA